MNIPVSNRTTSPDGLSKLSIAVWVGVLILVGTYIRSRPGDTVPEADWLVIAQLLTCFFGGVLGILLMWKRTYFGFGTKVLLVYLVASAFSAVFSPYPKIVSGYWILLSGASLLTMGLVQQAQTQKGLSQIENVWLITLTVLLLKDTMTALLFPEMQEIDSVSGPIRLGMGVTHANKISLLAALAFWVSFKKDEMKHPLLLWLPRLLFLLIIVLSRSRVSMVCFIVGGVVRSWFRHSSQPGKSSNLRIATPCFVLVVIISGILALSLELPGVNTAFNSFNRGQDIDTIMSLTGRTEVWHYSIKRVFDDSYSLLFGHGYGVSRLVLNEGTRVPSFFAYHTHNGFIEVLLSTGLLGAVPFAVLVIYSIMWLTGFSQLRQRFSLEFALRAISVVSMVLISSITNPYVGTKINPIMIIYIFYLLALDKRRHFA